MLLVTKEVILAVDTRVSALRREATMPLFFGECVDGALCTEDYLVLRYVVLTAARERILTAAR